jgi:hypothetical protein
MYDRVLKRMRDKIRSREYVVTLHAEEEMDFDGVTIFDVENCILSGKITERQKDVQTRESKYRLRGRTIAGRGIEVIGKLGPTGKLVIITAYLI